MDCVTSSEDDVQLVGFRERAPVSPAPYSLAAAPPSRPGSCMAEVETGTSHWTRKYGVPKLIRVTEISKALTQVLRHAAPRLGIEMQEDGYVDMGPSAGPTILEAVGNRS